MPRADHKAQSSIDTTSTQASNSTTTDSPTPTPTPTAARKRKRSQPTDVKSTTKQRLTPDQRSDNHKEAENRRRNAIREEYARLAGNIPGAEGLEKSEEKLLVLAADFLREMLVERRRLVKELEGVQASQEMGVDLAGWKLDDTQWGGPKFDNRCEEEYFVKRDLRLQQIAKGEKLAEEGEEGSEEQDSGEAA